MPALCTSRLRLPGGLTGVWFCFPMYPDTAAGASEGAAGRRGGVCGGRVCGGESRNGRGAVLVGVFGGRRRTCGSLEIGCGSKSMAFCGRNKCLCGSGIGFCGSGAYLCSSGMCVCGRNSYLCCSGSSFRSIKCLSDSRKTSADRIRWISDCGNDRHDRGSSSSDRRLGFYFIPNPQYYSRKD